jgi:hypothetical protein
MTTSMDRRRQSFSSSSSPGRLAVARCICRDRYCAIPIPGVARIHEELFPASRCVAHHCSHPHTVLPAFVSFNTILSRACILKGLILNSSICKGMGADG